MMGFESRKVAQFRLVELLGEGGMGEVYRAEDERLQRTVALKLLPGSFTANPERRARFLREARAAAAIVHGNIATVFEIGESGDDVFIAMEYVRGRNLREVLVAERLGAARAIHVAIEIARGLCSAHAAGVVHRDLKPENVMLSADDEVKILDFGLARIENPVSTASSLSNVETETHLTVDGSVIGTPGYMSPEQGMGERLDWRTDLFSLGVVLYEMLTGRRPFGGATAIAAIVATSRDPHVPLSTYLPGVSPQLQTIVDRCLAKAPEHRYQSARELLVDLRAQAATSASDPRAAVTLGPMQLGSGGQPSEPKNERPDPTSGSRPESRTPSGGFPDSVAGRLDAESTSPLPITGHPAPSSSSPEALEAYAAALQAMRDADWKLAFRELERAVSHDPRLAAARLRHALAAHFRKTRPEVQVEFKKALKLRDSLEPRDRALLRAWEPLLLFESADFPETHRRLVVLAERHPNDAEFQVLGAWWSTLVGDTATAARLARRALAIDPLYADAWQTVAQCHLLEGDTPAALEALDRGLEVSPGGADLYFEQAKIHAMQGHHALVEATTRRGLSFGPNHLLGHLRASAIFALGRHIDAVRDVLVQALADWSADRRQIEAIRIDAYVPILVGDFEGSRGIIEAALESVSDSPDSPIHAFAAGLRVSLALETGELDRAGEIACAYLDRRELWARPANVHDDPSPLLAAVALRVGRFSSSQAKSVVDSFVEQWAAASPATVWILARAPFARVAGSTERTPEALPAPGGNLLQGLHLNALIGGLLRAEGRLTDAVGYLRIAARTTSATVDPFLHTYASYELGLALEATVDRPGALAAYRTVLGRWGNARPRSVTAEIARERITALGE